MKSKTPMQELFEELEKGTEMTEEVIKTFKRREKEYMSYFYYHSDGEKVADFEELFKQTFKTK